MTTRSLLTTYFLLVTSGSALALDPAGRQEIVITATRNPVNVKESPASVSVITAADMEKMTLFTVDEALKNTVGVMNRRTKGFMETTASLTIRGFSNARDNLLLVDGIAQNDSRNGQINWTMIDTENVERIEVVRGPFSSLYGSSAMGGVINIITRAPEQNAFNIKLGIGGSLASIAPDNSRDLAASGSVQVHDRLTISASARQRSTDGYATTHVNGSASQLTGVTGATAYLNNIGTQTYLVGDSGDNWYDDNSAGLRLTYVPTEQTRIDLSWATSDGNYGYDHPHTYLRDAAGNPTYGSIPPASWLNGAVFARGGNSRQTNSGFSISSQIGEISTRLSIGHISKSTTTVIVGGITLANSGHSALTPVTWAEGDGRLAPVSDSTRSTIDWQFDWSPSEHHLLTMGIAASQGEIDEQRWSLSDWTHPGSKYFLGSQTRAEDQQYSIFLQDAWQITEQLTAYLGTRQDWWQMQGGSTEQYTLAGDRGRLIYEKTDARAISPKLSLVYRAQPSTTLRFSIGKAFRPPNLFEFFGSAQIGGDQYVGNPDLKPEQARSWELGIDHDFDNGIGLIASAYSTRLENMIQTVSANDISQPANAGEARIKGFELEVDGPLPLGFSWSANLSLTDSEITRHPLTPELIGKQLTHVPERMFNAGLNWTHKQWQLAASQSYQSKRFTRADNLDTFTGAPGTTDAFSLTDIKAIYTFSSRYSASLGINNLFDREYRQFYLSPGRFWFMELRAGY